MAELSPSRRRLLTTAASLPAVALAGPADPHPVWLAEAEKRIELINSYTVTGEEGDRVFQEELRLLDLVYETPATTLTGIRAQIAACVRAWEEGSFDWPEGDCLKVALAGLDRIMEGQAYV